MQTIQQERAGHALKGVNDGLEGLSEKEKREYRAAARGLGPMVLSNGLGQAAAFYCSRADKTHVKLYALLSEWLTESQMPYREKPNLLEGITEGNMDQYLTAQAEALLYLHWVSMFATALIRTESNPGRAAGDSDESPAPDAEEGKVE